MGRRAGLVATLGLVAVLISGCSSSSIDNGVLRFGWPSGITPQVTEMRVLWTWSVIAALAMGVLVWGLTFWTMFFHRKKKDSPEFPRQTGYNVPLELFYTAVPFVIISVLFYFTIIVQNNVNDRTDDPDVRVNVTAFQWNWKFGYADVDLKDGSEPYDGRDLERQERAESFNDAAYEALNAGDHEGEEGHEVALPIHGNARGNLSYLQYDKIETVGSSEEVPVLVLPTNRRIEFVLNATDVIHAFWVPEFLFKRDVMPSPEANRADNVFQISEIEREGAFVGRCAEMCGAYHSMMNFEVRAVSPERFMEYLQLRKPVEDGGEGLSNAAALAAIGEEPIATTTRPFETKRTATSAVNYRSGN